MDEEKDNCCDAQKNENRYKQPSGKILKQKIISLTDKQAKQNGLLVCAGEISG